MPRIKCPNCGKERIVVEGKRKKCRRCGAELTTMRPREKPVETVTAELLEEKYPALVERIRREAVEQAGIEIGAEEIEELGEVTTELFKENYPELIPGQHYC